MTVNGKPSAVDRKPKRERDMRALEASVRFAIGEIRGIADNLEAILEELESMRRRD